VRLFIGLELDAPVRAAAAEAASRLQQQLSAVAPDFEARWVPPENLHITVWFFGEVADPAAARLAEHLSPPLGLAAFDLGVRGCGAFPRSGAPRVLWIGTGDGTAGMIAAHARLVERLARLGHAPEARPFSPHLTLARVKEPGGMSRAVRQVVGKEPAECGRMTVSALTLFRSRLSGRGAVYEPLQRVPLS
jgi:RNA 2',3'-cyclic 3'-phosphodiesterase